MAFEGEEYHYQDGDSEESQQTHSNYVSENEYNSPTRDSRVQTPFMAHQYTSSSSKHKNTNMASDSRPRPQKRAWQDDDEPLETHAFVGVRTARPFFDTRGSVAAPGWNAHSRGMAERLAKSKLRLTVKSKRKPPHTNKETPDLAKPSAHPFLPSPSQENGFKRRKVLLSDADETSSRNLVPDPQTPKSNKRTQIRNGQNQYGIEQNQYGSGQTQFENGQNQYGSNWNQISEVEGSDIFSSSSSSHPRMQHTEQTFEADYHVHQEDFSIFDPNFTFNSPPASAYKNGQQRNLRRRKSVEVSPRHSPRIEEESDGDEEDDEGEEEITPFLSSSKNVTQSDRFQSLPSPTPSSSPQRYRSISSVSREPPSTPTPSSEARTPLNKITLSDRKRIFVTSNRPSSLTKAMTAWVTNTQAKLDPFRTSTECWFHPKPPPPHRVSTSANLRPYGKIAKTFTWADETGRHSLVLNYGICAKLINRAMNKQQRDGWINQNWHLSHLCGNWTCVNPEHATVESCATNVQRNTCFSHRDGCVHAPKCLKDMKVALGADGKLVPKGDGVEKRIRKTYHWEEWWSWDEVLEKIKKGDLGIGEVVEWEEYEMMADDEEDEDNEKSIDDVPEFTEV